MQSLGGVEFGVAVLPEGGCYVFSCNIPPCLLVVVTWPYPVASSFSSVHGDDQAHAPFGQYAPNLYVFSHNIYGSPLIALCLYSLLSHMRDFALPAIAVIPDTLSSPLVVPIRENPLRAIVAALRLECQS
jgi:hypothetical protein